MYQEIEKLLLYGISGFLCLQLAHPLYTIFRYLAGNMPPSFHLIPCLFGMFLPG